jgi:hypothetical protein
MLKIKMDYSAVGRRTKANTRPQAGVMRESIRSQQVELVNLARQRKAKPFRTSRSRESIQIRRFSIHVASFKFSNAIMRATHQRW